jgi:hypothetical protein
MYVVKFHNTGYKKIFGWPQFGHVILPKTESDSILQAEKLARSRLTDTRKPSIQIKMLLRAIQIIRDTLGGTGQCHQMTREERGFKLAQKIVTYYLNDPFNHDFVLQCPPLNYITDNRINRLL